MYIRNHYCLMPWFRFVSGHLAYTLSVRLSTISNPLACLLVLFMPLMSVPWLTVLVSIGSLFSTYLIFLAALSPTPPLQDSAFGVTLVVCTMYG